MNTPVRAGSSACRAGWLVAALLCAAFADPESVRGQPTALAAGDRVRLRGSAPGAEWIEGDVVAVEDGVLRLRSSAGSPTRWPLSGIAAMEVSRSARKRVVEGALLGLGVGLGLRLLIHEPREDEDAVGSALLASQTRNAVVVAGMLLGALTGMQWLDRRWEVVPLPMDVRAGAGASGSGAFSLAVRVAF